MAKAHRKEFLSLGKGIQQTIEGFSDQYRHEAEDDGDFIAHLMGATAFGVMLFLQDLSVKPEDFEIIAQAFLRVAAAQADALYQEQTKSRRYSS